MGFGISIDREDLQEVKNNYEKLSGWLTNNFTSFPACVFVLQSVMNAVCEAERRLDSSDEED